MGSASFHQTPNVQLNTFIDFGIEIPPNRSGEVRTTCPQCSPNRKKSSEPCLTVNTDKQVWFCHHCGWRGGLTNGVSNQIKLPEPYSRLDESRRETLQRIWDSTIPSNDPNAEPLRQYLSFRGLEGVIGHLTNAVRFHPGLDYWHDGQHLGQFPALLCRVSDVEGKPVSILRVFLTTDGKKAPVPNPKKLMSPVSASATRGAAIRLYPCTDKLAVTEGVETALAVHLATRIPTWATISAGGMQSLLLPKSIHQVVIMADLDRSMTGEVAARKLAARLFEEGRDARIVMPDGPIPEESKSVDWLDILNEGISP